MGQMKRTRMIVRKSEMLLEISESGEHEALAAGILGVKVKPD